MIVAKIREITMGSPLVGRQMQVSAIFDEYKGKGFPYSLPSVGPGANAGVQ